MGTLLPYELRVSTNTSLSSLALFKFPLKKLIITGFVVDMVKVEMLAY
jgi:hypothetical protein